MSKIVYSTVESVTDMAPRKRVCSWGSLASRLMKVEARGRYTLEEYLALSRQEKRLAKNGPGWVPGKFVDNGKREDADLIKLYAFVGDCDNNTTGVRVTLDKIKEVLNGYDCVIHTTYSHSREKAKFRFVVPYRTPIAPEAHLKVFNHFNSRLDGGLDPKGKTPSQLYFWPSCPPDARATFKAVRGRGRLFDATKIKKIFRVTDETETASSKELTVALSETLPTVDLGKLKLSKRLKELIRTGKDKVKQYTSRSEAIFAVTLKLVSSGLSDDEIAAILLDKEYGITSKIYEQKNPRKYVINTLRKVRSTKYVGSNETIEGMIAEMNAKHAIVAVGGKAVIMTETVDPVLKRPDILLSYERDLRLMYANRKLMVNEKPMSIADIWIEHEARRQYDRIIFSPQRDIPGCYNLWRGFSVEPRAGCCDLYLEHLRRNICTDDDEIYRYVIGFMADAVQNPSRLPGVAFVMRGDEGVGKGVFASQFGSLFGQHYVQVSHSRHLVGNFNAHLKDSLVVFADEAFWAGDKSSQGVLNAIITEPTRVLEHKGKDPITVANMCRLIIASNHEWVVPAGPMARRFFMVDVSDRRRQDIEYFKAINKEMANGGREALLHYLLNVDLTDFDLHGFPRTAALLDQQIRTMSPDEKFWFNRLRIGELTDFSGTWGDNGRVKCRTFHDQYVRSLQKDGYTRRSGETEFGIFLYKVCPEMQKVRRRMKEDDERFYVYEFPSLERCRALFAARMNTTIDWKK